MSLAAFEHDFFIEITDNYACNDHRQKISPIAVVKMYCPLTHYEPE
jgi:hypothetical protein